MSIHDCPDCLRFWQTYLTAAVQCRALKSEQKLALANDDFETAILLVPQIQAAEQAQERAKEQADDHQLIRHRLLNAA